MKKVKIIIDITMYILFIILMGHHVANNLFHEIIGTISFLLVITHIVLNFKFYKTMFKGKYNKNRIIMTIIDILMLILMIMIIISSIMISKDVFVFLKMSSMLLGKKLHMISTSWFFILLNLHIGIHIKPLILKINKKMKENTFEYVYYFVVLLIIVHGVYSFIKLNIINDMFVIELFRVYDEHYILFYTRMIIVSISIALLYNFISIIFNKKKEIKK